MIKLISLLISLIPITSTALDPIEIDGQISKCQITPEIKSNLPEPQSFSSSNNLTSPDGNLFYKAKGKEIIFYGRIMDANCLPINDAKIFIWQVNYKGYFQYEINDLKDNIDYNKKWIDPNFSSTGITNSNNLGRFNFKTIIPGKYKNYTPNINILVKHPLLKDFQTKIYFSKNSQITDLDEQGDITNIKDLNILKKISARKSNKENIYNFDIVLKQSIQNKSY